MFVTLLSNCGRDLTNNWQRSTYTSTCDEGLYMINCTYPQTGGSPRCRGRPEICEVCPRLTPQTHAHIRTHPTHPTQPHTNTQDQGPIHLASTLIGFFFPVKKKKNQTNAKQTKVKENQRTNKRTQKVAQSRQ